MWHKYCNKMPDTLRGTMSARDVLSTDEMNTLLHEDGRKPLDPDQAARDGMPLHFYDFISEYHKSLTKSRSFQIINLTFAAELKERLFKILRKKIPVEVIEPEVSTFEQYLNNNTEQSVLNLMKIPNSNDFALILLDRYLLFSCTEILFGGKPIDSAKLLRDFSHVDLRLSQLFCEHISESLQLAWENSLNLDLQHVKSSKELILPNRLNRNEKIIIMQYRIKIDEITSRLDICIPHTLISDAVANEKIINNSDDDEHTEWTQALKQNLYNANINISAEITEAQISLKDVANLSVGDVIAIDNPSQGFLLAEGEKIFKVKCGVHDGTKVVEVIERIAD